MNRIDVLLKSPFSSLSIEEKLETKKLGAHQPRAVVPKRCVATPWCVGRDHEVCREIKKKYLN
jgi:hypothetical protein